mmetsp:Transcript_4090/g.9684  ORF Transcript_4090/g.9684 Transcript_4090/m.9684 type:complete len:207 (-) Transcript_4090:566-1186(-)
MFRRGRIRRQDETRSARPCQQSHPRTGCCDLGPHHRAIRSQASSPKHHTGRQRHRRHWSAGLHLEHGGMQCGVGAVELFARGAAERGAEVVRRRPVVATVRARSVRPIRASGGVEGREVVAAIVHDARGPDLGGCQNRRSEHRASRRGLGSAGVRHPGDVDQRPDPRAGVQESVCVREPEHPRPAGGRGPSGPAGRLRRDSSQQRG